jgi:hypothetical protein
LAGLARAALAQGEGAQAMAHVEEILGVLETLPQLKGTWQPLRVYLTCYQVLQANDDPRAEAILEAGYQLIRERADRIDDERLRRLYMKNVAAHREIVAEWERLASEGHDRL